MNNAEVPGVMRSSNSWQNLNDELIKRKNDPALHTWKIPRKNVQIHINISRISQIAKLKVSHVWNINEIRIYQYAANKSTDF